MSSASMIQVNLNSVVSLGGSDTAGIWARAVRLLLLREGMGVLVQAGERPEFESGNKDYNRLRCPSQIHKHDIIALPQLTFAFCGYCAPAQASLHATLAHGSRLFCLFQYNWIESFDVFMGWPDRRMGHSRSFTGQNFFGPVEPTDREKKDARSPASQTNPNAPMLGLALTLDGSFALAASTDRTVTFYDLRGSYSALQPAVASLPHPTTLSFLAPV
jgi:hypothetical protein